MSETIDFMIETHTSNLRCDGAFYFSRTESKLQPSKSCALARRNSLGNKRPFRTRQISSDGRQNKYKKKKKNTRSSLANVWREGPEKCDESIVRCIPIYTYVYVSIPGGSTHPRSLKPQRRSSLSLSLYFFPLTWYAPVDKSRLPLLKDRGIGDKAGAEWRPGARKPVKRHPSHSDEMERWSNWICAPLATRKIYRCAKMLRN